MNSKDSQHEVDSFVGLEIERRKAGKWPLLRLLSGCGMFAQTILHTQIFLAILTRIVISNNCGGGNCCFGRKLPYLKKDAGAITRHYEVRIYDPSNAKTCLFWPLRPTHLSIVSSLDGHNELRTSSARTEAIFCIFLLQMQGSSDAATQETMEASDF
jgi:hypothetical protein